MCIERLAEQSLRDILASDKVGANLGARQVGKHNVLLGSPAELYFWRTRTQSEVDLVVKQGSLLRAFEVKWSARRGAGRAFRDAYGVAVETIRPERPFALEVIEPSP